VQIIRSKAAPPQPLYVEITETANPSPAQQAAWAALWGRILAEPEHTDAPTGEVEASESGAVRPVRDDGGRSHDSTAPTR
jgi:hypothetical protein